MTPKNPIVLFHTGAAHVATFDGLLDELAPGTPVRHEVRPELLARAVAAGHVAPELEREVVTALGHAAASGAALVLLTCSTLGPCADLVEAPVPILRVDRPMAEQAVKLGTRIAIAAAVETTIGPTRDLILEAARAAARAVEIEIVLCPQAWPLFLAGDHAGYVGMVVDALRPVATRVEVIVLAQASMAGAARHAEELGVPVLASPRLGLAAALRAAGVTPRS
jgi:hypothetical protein